MDIRSIIMRRKERRQMDEIAVLIPCYNEAVTIRKVIEKYKFASAKVIGNFKIKPSHNSATVSAP